MKQRIESTNERTQQTVNKHRRMAPQLKKGDKVYLLTNNLTTRRPSKKLDHVKVGPFLVKEARGQVNYLLDLPADAKAHPVFHISLLEPADPRTPLQTIFRYKPEEEDNFEVEKILEQDGQRYLIKWKGYPDSENTWEPKTNLTNCQELLRQFYQAKQNHPERKESGTPRKIDQKMRRDRGRW